MKKRVSKEEIKPVIILSGPVGAGKTTVAKELVKMLPGPVSYIKGDKFWAFVAKGFDHFKTLTNFQIIMRSMTAAAIPYARVGYQVVIDFSIPPWYMGVIFDMLNKRNIPVEYVIINPGEKVCTERAANREEGKITDYSECKKLYDTFSEAQKYTIHDEVNEAEIVAEHIMEGLNEGMFRVSSWEKE